MHFQAAEVIEWIGSYFWPFVRIGGMLMIAPIFSGRMIPVRIRMVVAIVLTITVAPLAPPMPIVDPLGPEGILITFYQLVIGLMMGFALRIVFTALEMGGQVIGQLMGLGFAQMVDPQNGISVPVVGQIYNILGTLIFVTLNGHLILIEVLANSFQSMPVTLQGIPISHFWDMLMWGSWMFFGAIMIAIPAIAALFMVNVAFAVLARTAPQLNIFAVGFPITLILGFVIIILSLESFYPQFEQLLENGFAVIKRIVGL